MRAGDTALILAIAKEIVAQSPGTTPRRALREARDIAARRGTYRVMAEDKVSREERGARAPVPEHVRATIAKQNAAAEERAAHGRSLPTAVIVSGGAVSPK